MHEKFCGEVNVSYCYFVLRIKEEPSEIHFPELDEMDEVNNPEHLLNLNGTVYWRDMPVFQNIWYY